MKFAGFATLTGCVGMVVVRWQVDCTDIATVRWLVGCRSMVAARWPVGYTGMATARYIASWLYRYGSCGMANGCWNIMADRGGVPAANACCCL